MTKQVILAENHYLVESSRTEKSQFGIGLARIRPQCVSAGGGGGACMLAHISPVLLAMVHSCLWSTGQ